ncbi:eukaryotic translation initiation factor 3 subunit K-like, partial [Onychostruthus taczanowskii]|uniref:eukaryotic translation initiation factor 3 subunit K-like n=1 Tax=Onychostruthus taczanowskii TaxID=356909 RepID=UPI001B809B84
ENLATLERYVETQAKENAYDLEANLAVLKLYQFNPAFFQTGVTAQILLKALTNLPHTDFTLCKCMIDQAHVSWDTPNLGGHPKSGTPQTQGTPKSRGNPPRNPQGSLGGVRAPPQTPLCPPESQLRVWMSKYGWTEPEPGRILISNQEENIKPKNIVEKIDFDSVSSIMASSL